ncbi:MAG TPA: VOC family protein [Coleofasciculaceae cyanobacterium]|jgi:uncharacterized glyoxalase superfamily protein PhnB
MPPEFYPMPSFPTLAVADLTVSSRWYQEVLGFHFIFAMPENNRQTSLVHLRWANYADLLLVPDRTAETKPKGIGITLTFAMFEGDIADFAQQIKMKGANIVGNPITRPWNVRELTVLDPDGYQLIFTQRIDPQMTLEQVIHQVTQTTATTTQTS